MPSPFVEIEVGTRLVRISNPDRVYFSARGETKLDLANYYLAVGDGIVRALRERPCMLHRYPDGVDGEKIYQKRLPKGAPEWVETTVVRFPSGRSADELCVTELADVIWAVQMSTVEFHPWHSRRADTERPDEMRIDLDPQPGTGLAEAKQVAAIVTRCSTSSARSAGRRPLAVEGYSRLRADRADASASARSAAPRWRSPARSNGGCPTLVTTAWWKEQRGEQIFIDYNQNARDRTIAPRTRCVAGRGGRCQHRSPGPSCPTSRWPTSRSRRCRRGLPSSATCTPASTTRCGRSSRCWSGPIATSTTAAWATCRTRRTIPKQEGEPPRVQPSRMNKANWDEAGDRVGEVEPQDLG